MIKRLQGGGRKEHKDPERRWTFSQSPNHLQGDTPPIGVPSLLAALGLQGLMEGQESWLRSHHFREGSSLDPAYQNPLVDEVYSMPSLPAWVGQSDSFGVR